MSCGLLGFNFTKANQRFVQGHSGGQRANHCAEAQTDGVLTHRRLESCIQGTFLSRYAEKLENVEVGLLFEDSVPMNIEYPSRGGTSGLYLGGLDLDFQFAVDKDIASALALNDVSRMPVRTEKLLHLPFGGAGFFCVMVDRREWRTETIHPIEVRATKIALMREGYFLATLNGALRLRAEWLTTVASALAWLKISVPSKRIIVFLAHPLRAMRSLATGGNAALASVDSAHSDTPTGPSTPPRSVNIAVVR